MIKKSDHLVFDFDKLSGRKETKDRDVIAVKFHRESIADLIELLRFSRMSANLLMNQELSKGTVDGAQRMKEYAELSADLIASLSTHLNIGEPQSDLVN
jgi:hypothetical protein